jgi:hypothetical protein
MTDELFDKIRKAVQMVEDGIVKRAEVDGAKVYAIPGSIIRVDIEHKE